MSAICYTSGSWIARRCFKAAKRVYTGLPKLDYPLNDKDIIDIARGRNCMLSKKIDVSTVLACHRLGIK